MNKNQALPWENPRFHNWIAVARACQVMGLSLARALQPLDLKPPHLDILVNLFRAPGISQQDLADKLLVGLALLGLAMIFRTWLVYIPAAAIIARDAFMTWLRTTPRGRAVVDPSNLAKWKTGFEMAAIIGLMLPLAVMPQDAVSQNGAQGVLAGFTAFLLVALLWIAAGLSVWTGWRYMKAAAQSAR